MTAGRRRSLIVRSVLVAGSVLLLAACGETDIADYPLDALSPEGPVAREQDRLWQIVFPVAVAVFVLVQGMILFAVFKFRDRGDGEMPKQVEGNTRLEIAWTIVPAVILAAIAVPTAASIFSLDEAPAKEERLDITVVGKQYFWEFSYPDEGFFTANEIVVPTGRPVYLHLDGAPDYEEVGPPENLVMHSFWVPRLAGKQDFVPGDDRFLTIEADEPGTYMGNCAEFCGLSHANMRIRVHAVEPEEYEDWVAEQSEPADTADDGDVAQGEEVFGANCVACHAVNGHPDDAGQRIGPDLTHFNSRDEFAGAIFDVDDDEQLRAWIRNPPKEKPGAQMPPFSEIPEEDLDALIEYLRSLD